MPPKRKPATGTASSKSPATAKRARTAARPLPTLPSSPIFRKPYKPGELCAYVAKVVSADDRDYISQRATCQRWASTKVHDQCISCIEKQAMCGTCRFLGFRVFRRTIGRNGKEELDYDAYAFAGVKGGEQPIELSRPVKRARKSEKKSVPRRSTRHRVELTGEDASGDDLSDEEEEVIVEKSGKVYPTPVLADPLTPTASQAAYMLPMIAPAFSGHLQRENWHERTHTKEITEGLVPGGAMAFVRIRLTPSARALCDICATSIYMGSYMCGCCGREYCLGCWEEWTPLAEVTGGRLPRMDQCSRKRRHGRASMVFVTRAKEGEVAGMLEKIKKHAHLNVPMDTTRSDLVLASIPKTTAASLGPGGPLYFPVPKIKHSELSLGDFQSIWRKGGIPLVLTGMLDRFQLPWDSQYFIDNHGEDQCFLHDCLDGSAHAATVAGFFSSFSGNPGTSFKLKDWPPSEDFRDTFPDLFADFENALPFPTYTRRSGPMNLASYFPTGWIAPDLGPKMYNAYPSSDFLPLNEAALSPKHKEALKQHVTGTTSLHLDLTDAVNIMLYASGGLDAPLFSTVEKKIPMCGAVWDIFPPSAAAKIRTYLKPRDDEIDDPIHRQVYYLSEYDLAQLAMAGVGSYRVYQNPGDAIFVPAGCPHQVRNRRSCVKVAVDFLTAENVDVCRGLLEEARGMAPKIPKPGNRGTAKEDVLQLWSCLGFSWEKLEALVEARGKAVGWGDNYEQGKEEGETAGGVKKEGDEDGGKKDAGEKEAEGSAAQVKDRTVNSGSALIGDDATIDAVLSVADFSVVEDDAAINAAPSVTGFSLANSPIDGSVLGAGNQDDSHTVSEHDICHTTTMSSSLLPPPGAPLPESEPMEIDTELAQQPAAERYNPVVGEEAQAFKVPSPPPPPPSFVTIPDQPLKENLSDAPKVDNMYHGGRGKFRDQEEEEEEKEEDEEKQRRIEREARASLIIQTVRAHVSSYEERMRSADAFLNARLAVPAVTKVSLSQMASGFEVGRPIAWEGGESKGEGNGRDA